MCLFVLSVPPLYHRTVWNGNDSDKDNNKLDQKENHKNNRIYDQKDGHIENPIFPDILDFLLILFTPFERRD